MAERKKTKSTKKSTMKSNSVQKKQHDIVEDVDIVNIVKKSYIDYALNIIVSRALPDVRDGLKPVQRRILYSMQEIGVTYRSPHVKSARIVGDTMGKYHPHGDTSIYDTMVRMAQPFSSRYPLIDGHGNFGTVDGDGAAAMRYTESRMSQLAEELTRDIDKKTIEFSPNFDNSLTEPVVMTSRFPNLLVNGSTGIAVGMATNMPPHNLNEVITAIIKVIDKPKMKDEELLEYIKGPDFPTGGIITNPDEIKIAYLTGRGKIQLRSKVLIEDAGKDKFQLVITEFPYEISTTNLINNIINVIKNSKDSVLNDIIDIRDESNKEGIRIVLELRKDASPHIVLNALYKLTNLQVTYGIINLAIVNGEPKELTLRELIDLYIEFQREILYKRTEYEINKIKDKLHILEGFIKVCNQIDKTVKLITSSKTRKEAEEKLITRYKLSQIQVATVLDLRLHKLTSLSIEDTIKEYNELEKELERLQSLLISPKKLDTVLKKELLDIMNRYGDERRTEIIDIPNDENIITQKEFVEIDLNITITSKGMLYISEKSNSQLQIDETQDFIIKNINCKNTDVLIVFDENNNYYKIKTSDLPLTNKNGRGTSIYNIISSLDPNTKILYYNIINDKDNILFVSKYGMIKRVELSEFNSARNTGSSTKLKNNDKLLSILDFDSEFIFLTRLGKVLRFKTDDVRPMGRNAIGITGIKLDDADDDYLILADYTKNKEYLFAVSDDGNGKKVPLKDFKIQGRATKGVLIARLRKSDNPFSSGITITKDKNIILTTSTGRQIPLENSSIETTKRTDIVSFITELRNKENVVQILEI